MKIIDKTPVIVTAGAIAKIKRLMAKENFDSRNFLRVSVTGGGCPCITYMIDFEIKTKKDKYFEINNIPCDINSVPAFF